MDKVLPFLSLIIFVLASLVLALPNAKARGCLSYIVRMVAFLAGSISPVLVLWRAPGVAEAALRWRFPSSFLTYLAILAAVVLGACAVTLAAAGLQILLRRGRGDFEDKIDLSWFGLPDFSSPTTNNLDVEGCIGIVLFAVVGGLFWLGLAIGSSINEFLTPREKTRGRRMVQSVSALVIGVVVFGLGAGLLLLLSRDAGASARVAGPPNIFLETPAPGSELAVKYSQDEVPARLQAMWGGVEKDSSLQWTPVYSPLFPTEWPPQPRTFWIRYAYATARREGLSDANVVSPPWAIVEYSAGSNPTGMVVPLGNRVEEMAVQGSGVFRRELASANEVFAYCLTLTSAPDEGSQDVVRMKGFYDAWMQSNGVITSLIVQNHGRFLAWLVAKP
jgi:hypothetical protein